MGCQCSKPSKDNPLNELLSDKERERNQTSNNINESINENVVNNNTKEITKLQNQENEKFLRINNIESYPQPEISSPIEFLNNENINNETNVNNDKLNNNNNHINENENENEKKNIFPLSDNLNDDDLLPKDSFSKYIFKHINLIRTNPKNYIPIIEKAKNNVIKDIHNRLLYKTKVKVALSKGIPIFDETISYLNQIEPMNKLTFNSKMCIPLPKNEEEINDKTYLKIKVRELLNNKIKIKTYWRDIIKEPETSFILMIVDDSGIKSGLKRRDILNPDIKYIGINSITINNSFVCYLTFSD